MITLSKVNKNYGFEVVLNQFSMSVNKGEKVGLIGANGSGKSTVFKLLAGLENADEGLVSVAKGLKVGYMNQMMEYKDDNKSVEDRLLDRFSNLQRLEKRIRDIESKMKEANDNQDELDRILQEYAKLSAEYEQSGGYVYRTKVSQIINGLGLDSLVNTLILELSGGERGRLQIAELLLLEPDVLLLDEPTNHLDFKIILWLEEYIKDYSGTVIIISHDRSFLDNTIGKIIEIKHGRGEEYLGNYSYYLTERERRYEIELKHYNDQQKEIKRREEAIKQLRRWGREDDNEKFHKRAASMEKQLAKVERLDNPDLGDTKFQLEFAVDRSGKEVVILERVSKSFANKLLLEEVDLKIFYGQKVGLIGSNGSGKSTLIKILLGEEDFEQGEFKLGSNIKIGYLSQHQELVDQDLTLLESFRAEAPPMYEDRARGILAAYGFKGENVFRYIRELSGGERVRFHLMKMVHSETNLLILDEPTNHLDIKSIEILENALEDYKGTLLVVSHDRYFLNKVIDTLYVVEDKKLKYYPGNYDYYSKKVETKQVVAITKKGKKRVRSNSEEDNNKKVAREIANIEEEIMALESRIEENNVLMIAPENINDYEYLNKLKEENEGIESRLEELMEKWEELVGS